MKLNLLFVTLIVFSILVIVGCSNKQDIEDINDADNFRDVKAVAWEFIGGSTAKEDWENEKVKKIVADNSFELLNKTYQDKEVLSVSFEDKEYVVIGTPIILVDPNTKEVIGYMPSE